MDHCPFATIMVSPLIRSAVSILHDSRNTKTASKPNFARIVILKWCKLFWAHAMYSLTTNNKRQGWYQIFTVLPCLYVTGPRKTGLIYTKYTCLHYDTYILFCMCYPKSGNFIEFLMDFCICDDILVMIQITDKKVLHFKLS